MEFKTENALEIYENELNKLVEKHMKRLKELRSSTKNDKDYIRNHMKETDKFRKEYSNLASEFAIDAINALAKEV